MTQNARFPARWRPLAADGTVSFLLRAILWIGVIVALTVPLMAGH